LRFWWWGAVVVAGIGVVGFGLAHLYGVGKGKGHKK